MDDSTLGIATILDKLTEGIAKGLEVRRQRELQDREVSLREQEMGIRQKMLERQNAEDSSQARLREAQIRDLEGKQGLYGARENLINASAEAKRASAGKIYSKLESDKTGAVSRFNKDLGNLDKQITDLTGEINKQEQMAGFTKNPERKAAAEKRIQSLRTRLDDLYTNREKIQGDLETARKKVAPAPGSRSQAAPPVDPEVNVLINRIRAARTSDDLTALRDDYNMLARSNANAARLLDQELKTKRRDMTNDRRISIATDTNTEVGIGTE